MDRAIDGAALQIEYVLEFFGVFKTDCVLHEHDVDFAEVGGFDGENAKYLGEQGVSIVCQVGSVLGHHLLYKGQLCTGHGLDDELLIVAEEEKAS